jgi:saccharopine dehydrogenase-like NADP-dependent oxidoreductase
MGGAAARLIARHRDEVDMLVLDVDEARAEKVVAEIGWGDARGFDAKSGELADILREVRGVAACLPYRLNLTVMDAALEARCNYADLGGLFHTTLKQLEYDARFREAGVAAVLGIGSAPGLTNVLAKFGADHLDSVTSIDMVDGAIEEGEGGFGVPYSVDTVFDEFTMPAMVFEGGELKEVPAGSGVVDWDFPEPLGTLPAMYTLHSEPATVPQSVPGVRDVRWRLALPKAVHEGFAFLTEIGMVSSEPVQTSAGAVAPRDVAAAVLNKLPGGEGEPHDIEYLDIRVEGEKDGKLARWRGLARLTPSPEGLSAGAFGTAIPIAVTARWFARDLVEPGVHPAELAFDNAGFIRELENEGVEFTFSLED